MSVARGSNALGTPMLAVCANRSRLSRFKSEMYIVNKCLQLYRVLLTRPSHRHIDQLSPATTQPSTMPQVRTRIPPAAAAKRRTAQELLQSSEDEKPDVPTPAGAELPALTSSAVRAPGQEEIIMVPDDFESPKELMCELNPNASEYVPLNFDSGSDPSDILAYIPNSRSSSPERGPDGAEPVTTTVPTVTEPVSRIFLVVALVLLMLGVSQG